MVRRKGDGRYICNESIMNYLPIILLMPETGRDLMRQVRFNTMTHSFFDQLEFQNFIGTL